ncbi:MAG: B12-binding domain-containing radical SAM protein [Elusimicrobia bacterium]|nr:B12-binding domain-containing radical SAM protein [Elusimicrobiota bacterium]
MSANRPARVGLIQAPAFFPGTPPGSLALLSAHLKRSGLAHFVRDSSLSLRRRLGVPRAAPDGRLQDANDLIASIKNDPRRLDAALNEEVGAILADEPDIVGFSVLVGTEEMSLDMAERIKRESPRTAVVFGGAQCLRDTLAEDMASSGPVDAVALGEADASLAAFARAFRPGSKSLPKLPGFLVRERGRVTDCGDAPETKSLDDLPFMDFDGFPAQGYDGYFYLNASRGCVRKCAFCTHILQQKFYRSMSAPRIAAEIRHQFERRPECGFMMFGDSLINGNVRVLSELSILLAQFRAEIRTRNPARDFGWGAMAIVHKTMTPGLLKSVRQGGCQTLIYGLESGSQKVVRLMNKNFAVSDAEDVLRATKAAGILPGLFLMVGFPGETEEDFQETLGFVRRNAPFIGQISTSLCDVPKGSALDAHPERYGLKTPLRDRLRWESADGSNTYAVRQERHGRLEGLVRGLGIPLNPPTVRILNQAPRERSRAN